MKGFLEFIQEQGVVGIAVAFVLGAAVTKLVSAFVVDIINPILTVVLKPAGGIANATFKLGPMVFAYGNFISVLIDFSVLCGVIYVTYKMLRLEKLAKRKE